MDYMTRRNLNLKCPHVRRVRMAQSLRRFTADPTVCNARQSSKITSCSTSSRVIILKMLHLFRAAKRFQTKPLAWTFLAAHRHMTLVRSRIILTTKAFNDKRAWLLIENNKEPELQTPEMICLVHWNGYESWWISSSCHEKKKAIETWLHRRIMRILRT